jgi:hypothetical protein
VWLLALHIPGDHSATALGFAHSRWQLAHLPALGCCIVLDVKQAYKLPGPLQAWRLQFEGVKKATLLKLSSCLVLMTSLSYISRASIQFIRALHCTPTCEFAVL